MKKYRGCTGQPKRRATFRRRRKRCGPTGWRVDYDKVVLFAHEQDLDILVFDVPKTRVMRIQEVA